jgi:hypothetical protein
VLETHRRECRLPPLVPYRSITLSLGAPPQLPKLYVKHHALLAVTDTNYQRPIPGHALFDTPPRDTEPVELERSARRRTPSARKLAQREFKPSYLDGNC